MNSALPYYTGPVDHLRVGFSQLDSGTTSHPVESIQKSTVYDKLDSMRRTYGIHMAIKYASNVERHSNANRLPGATTTSFSSLNFLAI